MLAHSELHRSIRAMSLGFARAVHKRSREPRDYDLTERELQFQYEIAGQVGTLPVESSIKLTFDVTFMTDSGNQRDSTLDRPQVRTAFEFDFVSTGMIPYVYISQWTLDDDLNIVGARVVVGVHSPAAQFQGLDLKSATYQGALHIAFQGWCLPNDPDGNYDAGGTIDIANPGAAN